MIELVIEPGAVHTWLVPVSVDERAAARRARLLSPDERERSRRYKSQARAAQFIAGRAALRALLGRITGQDPARLRFAQNSHGKPELAGGLEPPDRPELHFNVAHSGAFVLVAVTRVGPVGVDLEAIRPVRGLDAIARRWLSGEELTHLPAAPAAPQGSVAGVWDEAFLRLWTRKEALFKAWGTGLAWSASRTVSACNDLVETGPLESKDGAPGANAAAGHRIRRWSIRSWYPAPGYVASAAAPGDSWRLVCELWESG